MGLIAMIHKQQILSAIEIEIKICKRLFTLLPQNSYEFKPQEGMRSTLELLKYLTWIAGACIEQYIFDPDYSSYDIYQRRASEAKAMNAKDFPVSMDKELANITTLMEKLNDKDWFGKEVTVQWGAKMKMGEAIIESSLKWLTGYKMQLFLYAKLSGSRDLNTGDCWFIT